MQNLVFMSNEEKEELIFTSILDSIENTNIAHREISQFQLEKQSENEMRQNDESRLNNYESINDCLQEQSNKENIDNFDEYIRFLKLSSDDQTDSCSSEFDDQSNNDVESDANSEFINSIRKWSIDNVHTIPHSAINQLICILREHTKVPFPKNARTLLKTPRTTHVIDMGSGQYCHYGIKSAIETFILQLLLKNISVDCITL